jgi:hypothetical protein
VQEQASFEATLRFAAALVKDGMTGVTVVIPRAPGVLAQARSAAEVAGIAVRAEYIGSTSITMRFSSVVPLVPPVRTRRQRRRWRALLGWSRPWRG